jgi:hypothetical protein
MVVRSSREMKMDTSCARKATVRKMAYVARKTRFSEPEMAKPKKQTWG